MNIYKTTVLSILSLSFSLSSIQGVLAMEKEKGEFERDHSLSNNTIYQPHKKIFENSDGAEEFALGISYYKKKKYKVAYKWLLRAYDKGQEGLECHLAFSAGSISEELAFEWYNKAASNGNSSGIIAVGKCYKRGIGCKINDQEALKYFLRGLEDERIASADYLPLVLKDIIEIIQPNPYFFDYPLKEETKEVMLNLEEYVIEIWNKTKPSDLVDLKKFPLLCKDIELIKELTEEIKIKRTNSWFWWLIGKCGRKRGGSPSKTI